MKNPLGQAVALLASLLVMAGPARADAVLFEFDWQPPAFTAVDADGASFTYPNDLGGATIVLFWATWCPFCGALMPHLQSILDEYGDDVQVIALNFREDQDPAEFLARFGYQFRLFPEADTVAEAWDVKGTPGLFLADANGRVVFSKGAIPREAYPAERFVKAEDMQRFQIAARVAPFWAALLRRNLDALLAGAEPPAD